MFLMDRRRAFGAWFWIAILAHLALYFNDVSYFIMDPHGDALMTYSLSAGVGMVTYMMPLFAALPFSTGFCADWNSGFSSAAALRSGKRDYLLSKVRLCALSGGLAPAAATLIFAVFLNLRFPTAGYLMESFAEGDAFNRILNLGAPGGLILYYAGNIAMQFLAGACWSLIGLAFSAFCPNVLLTLCVPLAAYRLSLEIYYWLELPLWLNLPLLQDCSVDLNYLATLLAGVFVFGGLSLIFAALFCFRAGRRLKYA